MKTRLLTLLVAIASFCSAHAREAALKFPLQRIDVPALSLSGAAQQAFERRVPTVSEVWREIRDERYSDFFLVRKAGVRVYSVLRFKMRDRIGSKFTVPAGKPSFDYKVKIAAFEVEPSK